MVDIEYKAIPEHAGELSHVVFRTLSSPKDDAVFVRLQPMQGQARLIPLERVGDEGWWEAHLQLQPDTYRYRYYRKTGSTIMYHPPTGGHEDCFGPWDAQLKVPVSKELGEGSRYDFPTSGRIA